jgi:signal transduction histidine kinase
VPAQANVSLGPDNAKVEFHFGVVLLRSQERVRFRYMLDAFDKEWSKPSLSRVAYYTNLPPGRYHFRVAAFELSNPEQMAETSLEIIQRPHFYRTPWFIAGCVLLAGFLVWAVYELRLTQVRARFQAVLKERNRLAREMHDTLIQGCASVSALLEAHSSMGDQRAKSDGQLLDYAREQLRATIDEARQAVWDLRQSAETTSDISPLLRKMAERVSHEFAVPIEYRASGKPFALDQATMHDVLMITREALYNSVRHGQPSAVTVDLSFNEEHVAIEVRDDGRGFDARADSHGGKHYGVIGMRERVERLGGKFTLRTQVGRGTTVLIEIAKQSAAKVQMPEVVS